MVDQMRISDDLNGVKKAVANIFLLFVLCAGLVAGGCGPKRNVEDHTSLKHVALVFDDGPFPEQTGQFLTVFSNLNVRVTFALVASNVQVFRTNALAILAGGHEIANHSYTHRKPSESDDVQLEREIVFGQSVIVGSTGYTPSWYWPPFLETDPRMSALYAKAGIKMFPFDKLVNTEDYDMSVSRWGIRKRATRNVQDGSVIVFHEWRKETLQEIPRIIAELKAMNCVFMTFSELGEERASSEAKTSSKKIVE